METEKHKSKKDKTKTKEKNDFTFLNSLEFSQLNNNIDNELLNIKLKEKKSLKKHKHKLKTNEKSVINNNDLKDNYIQNNIINEQNNNDDSDYLEKKYVKNNLLIDRKNLIISKNTNIDNQKKVNEIDNTNSNIILNKQVKSTNPIIQNEVIWYSDDLDSNELENKFKNKFNNINKKNEVNNEVNNKDNEVITGKINNYEKSEYYIDDLKIHVINGTNDVEKYFTNNPEITMSRKVRNRLVDCRKCITECKKIDYNTFVLDTSCDPNTSAHILFDNCFGLTHLNDMFFISEGKKYIPEVVEIYLNDNILIRRINSEITKNINLINIQDEYRITHSPFHIFTDIKITIKIIDSKEIDTIYFNTSFEKLIGSTKDAYLYENNSLEIISLTHELLYEGIDVDIKINREYGYYESIYIICENILDNIKSISLTNTDVILFKNIPIKFLEPSSNSLIYSLKFGDTLSTGLKVDSNNWIDIKLDKINKDKKIKIYGNKYNILYKDSKIKKIE